MSTQSFVLIDRPWICVRDSRNRIDELSLADVFRTAHRYEGLSGEGPTQDIAILRLLLAILRRSHAQARTTQDWERMWSEEKFVPKPIEMYLERWQHRFDLLHAETPFYQVASLRTEKDQMGSGAARLIADVPLKNPYFSLRAGNDINELSFPEAARWLVHLMAYDFSGIKSGAMGDDRVKQGTGKGYPIGVAWCGELGAVVLEGRNLFETLMLNLQLGSRLPPAERDLPVWERQPLGPGIEVGHNQPTGPVDLLTWPSRRVRLGHDGRRVTGVLVANGDPLHARNMFPYEFMTAWRYSENQTKTRKSADPVFMPRTFAPDRSVWRGLDALLVPERDSPLVKAGRWLEWLEEIREEALGPEMAVRVRTVSIQYGANNSFYSDITTDALPLRAAVLTAPVLRAAAIDAVGDVDRAASALGQFAGDLVRAAGGDRDLAGSARHDAREQVYAALDSAYRRWVAGLLPDDEPDRVGWQRHVRDVAVRLGRDRLDSVSPAAWTGLPASEERKQPMNAATAANWFHINLRRDLPDAFGTAKGPAA